MVLNTDPISLKVKNFHLHKEFREFMDNYLPNVKQEIDNITIRGWRNNLIKTFNIPKRIIRPPELIIAKHKTNIPKKSCANIILDTNC